MISRIKGILVSRDTERIEVETAGGVVYELEVPLTVLERLPRPGAYVEMRTVQLVREDSVALYGFLDAVERELFGRLISTSGVGGKLALAMMSAYNAGRLVRALVEKDVNALKQVSGVGKKTAERLVLELSDKVEDLALVASVNGGPPAPGMREAVSALVVLGYTFAEADDAVRAALQEGVPPSVDELIRKALAHR